MGRPSKLTPEVQKTITDAIEVGATYQAAAEYARVSYKTFNEWMAKGEKRRKPYGEFREAVEQANARAKISLLDKIQKADDWRSKAWILERRFPDEYGLKVKQEHTGEGGSAIRVEYVNDWRGSFTDAASGPALGAAERAPVQLAGGGAPLAEDDPGDGDRG